MCEPARACSPVIESVVKATQRDSVAPSRCWTTTATRWVEAAAQVAADPGHGMTEAGTSRARPRIPDSRTRRKVSVMLAGSTFG